MSFEENIEVLKKDFSAITEPQEKYHKIIEMGKKLPPFDPSLKIEENRVKGCQSQAYLNTTYNNGKVEITGFSDALISAGLLSILISIFNKESPNTIIQSSPSFLTEIGLEESISPNRANGLYDAFLLLKKKVLYHLVQEQKKS